MEKTIVNSDHVKLDELDLDMFDISGDDDFDDSDIASGLMFDELDRVGRKQVMKEMRRFKKGF